MKQQLHTTAFIGTKNHLRKTAAKTILFFALLTSFIINAQNIRYVKPTGTATATGNSWANASNDLQAMINASTAGNKIFVAAGTYKPKSPANDLTTIDANNRDNSFVLKNGVKIYGGFAGTESTLTQRNVKANPTILSGDLGTPANTDNAYHVVISVSDDATTILDGFTITGGNANGSIGSYITVENKVIMRYFGGGMFNNENSSPSITNCSFSSNNTTTIGGGMFNGNYSSPSITNCSFSSNTANNGGGIYNGGSTASITNCSFISNKAIKHGGGINNGGLSVNITNCSFISNTAFYGGGMFNENCSPKIYNSIFWFNKSGSPTLSAYRPGADISNTSSNVTVKHSLLQLASSDYITTNYNELLGNTGNIYAKNPLFVSPTDLRLRQVSPAINAGDKSLFNTTTYGNKDLAGNPRVYNGIPTTDKIDMGAYEYQGEPLHLQPDANNILYVDKNAPSTSTKNGSTWQNAVPELADALKWASTQPTAVTSSLQIWVADGTYKPLYKAGNGTSNRDKAFVLVNKVKIYGGFAGTETALSQRDITANPSILSGDLDNNNAISNNDAYHVVISVSDNNTTILDGFTITGGNANVLGSYITVETKNIYKPAAGGMYNDSSSPSITNCSFSANNAQSSGGGMLNNTNSSPRITNCTFSANTAFNGGGMFNGESSPRITNCSFSANNATNSGGGMLNETNSSPSITNCTFSSNTSTHDGGGMYNNESSSPRITNCTFSSNTATKFGGGMFNYESSPEVYNSIFWGNQQGSPLSATTAGADIKNSSLFGPSTATVEHSLLQLAVGDYTTVGSTGFIFASTDNNIYDSQTVNNPNFTDASGGDFSLRDGSPAIDKGDNTKIDIAVYPKDLAGNPRIFNSGTVDMGAYENQNIQLLPTANILYVDKNAPSTSTKNGSDWQNAVPELADALKWASTQTPAVQQNLQIWVADGTYKPLYKPFNNGVEMTTGDNRNKTFHLVNKVKIYGGFAGNETVLSARNVTTNPTILSGDLGTAANTDNACHVVISVSDNATTVLDGFTITGGNANPFRTITVETKDIYGGFGGGILNFSSSPSITNCSFISNNAAAYGGGIYNKYSSPSITNCSFSSNKADRGAGMYNELSSPSITNCSFSSNRASVGGGMNNYLNSFPSITNCSFSSNTAVDLGGGIFNRDNSSPIITNCSFISNTSDSGGGMFNYNSSSPKIYNSIFWKNKKGSPLSAITPGADIENGTSTITVEYSLLQLAGGSYTNGFNVSDNIYDSQDTNNPKFLDAPNGDFSIKVCSPAKDAGDNSRNTQTKDLAGNDRIYNNVTIDMGAYENQAAYPSNPIISTLSPLNSATSVAINSDLEIMFDKAINFGTTGNITLHKVGGTANPIASYDVDPNATVSTTLAVSIDRNTNTLKINPSADLENGESYYVQIDNTAIRGCTQNFFTGIGNNSDWNFTAEKATPTLTFANITKYYGDADFPLSASSSNSSGAISYSIIPGGTGTASLSGANNETVNLGNAGTVTIRATIAATTTHSSVTKDMVLTINKKALKITAEAKTKVYGATDPSLTYTITGFENGDTKTDLDTAVSISRAVGENVGTYTITPSGATDANYTISFATANFEITEVVCLNSGKISRHWDDALFFDNTDNIYSSYQWYKDDVLLVGATKQYYHTEKLMSGNYHVVAKTSSGKVVKICPLYVNTNKTTVNLLQLFPNPVNQGDNFTLKVNYDVALLQGAVLTIYNSIGQKLQVINNVSSKNTLKAPNVSGIYIIRLVLGNGKQKSISLVVK